MDFRNSVFTIAIIHWVENAQYRTRSAIYLLGHELATEPEIRKFAQKKRTCVSRTKIITEYNHHLFQYVREIISTFALKHRNSLQDIIFECDGDCRDFLKNNALKYGDEGFAYKLSDIIAWANNHGREPKGVRSIDVTEKIKTTLRYDFK